MNSEHPVVRVIKEYIAPEHLHNRIFPIVDLEGQLIASIDFTINEFSTTIHMKLIDGSDENDITVSDELQADHKKALEDACYMLIYYFGLDADEVRILIPEKI